MDEEVGYGCGCLVLIGIGILIFKPLSDFFLGLLGGLLQILFVVALVAIAIYSIRFVIAEQSGRNLQKRIDKTWEEYLQLVEQNVTDELAFEKALAEFGLEEDDVEILAPIIHIFPAFEKQEILNSEEWAVRSTILLFGEDRMYQYTDWYDLKSDDFRIIKADIINYTQIMDVSIRNDKLIITVRGRENLKIFLDNESERNTARGLRNLFSEKME